MNPEGFWTDNWFFCHFFREVALLAEGDLKTCIYLKLVPFPQGKTTFVTFPGQKYLIKPPQCFRFQMIIEDVLLRDITDWLHNIFYKQYFFFSTQPQCCLTISWFELQMLLRCCLTHTSIIRLRHILYLVYLCPSLGLIPFMSYLCNLFFLFSFSCSS